MEQVAKNPELYATTFGYSGTYWDYVQEILAERGSLLGLVNLELRKSDIDSILKESGFVGYRLDGASSWIMKAIDMLRICNENEY